MNNRTNQIGFSQRIRAEWLERTANLVLAGSDRKTIETNLKEFLRDKLSVGSNVVRGNREKAISILLKTWVHAPKGLEVIQEAGLNLLKTLNVSDHIAVHWGMVTAVYPFWGVVASHVGRLLRLQGTGAASHIQRRIREIYGERETVHRAARRIIRSFIDWGILEEDAKKGIYRQGLVRSVDNPAIIAWLVETSLYAHPGRSTGLREILTSTSLFPFRLANISAKQLTNLSPHLEILRHGLDEDLVMLREVDKGEKTLATPKNRKAGNHLMRMI